ncbi:MAG: sugar phosphate isomerase/epimerase [Phycisphaerales bacterium]|nr:sugar phosphate isomerase/epimerase [Phycisphaerales bacterium]
MPDVCDRRTALKWTTASLAAAALGTVAAPAAPAAADEPPTTRPLRPLFDLSLAQWSLHRALHAGTLDHLDFAGTAAERFGIHAVEYVNSFFKDKATDAAYLADMNRRAADANVRQLLIMVDGEGRLGDPDDDARTRAVEAHYKWVDAAKTLGCHSIRVNAASAGTPDEQRAHSRDGLRRLTEFAAARGINVIVENHGGLSSDGSWLASVIRAVDHPRCGTLPDFGNFRVSADVEYDRYRGVAELMPFAKAVSAKSYAFDERGDETTIDYRRMMSIVVDAGYRGFVGIEYEGSAHPEDDGIRLTKTLLERLRADLTKSLRDADAKVPGRS